MINSSVSNMASLRRLVQCSYLVNFNLVQRSRIIKCERKYSVFPPTYVKPVYTKDAQKTLEASGEVEVIMHSPVKPALTSQTSSEFHDATISKFINYLTREGNKERARNLLERTFENVKRIQLQKYHKSSPEDQQTIELDPKVILHNAIENSTPVLELLKMKRGGQTYQVPVPLTEKRASFLAMNWIIRVAKEKEQKVHLPDRLAYELIDAHHNQGRVIRKKQELYRQCEANRSYAHFRWT